MLSEELHGQDSKLDQPSRELDDETIRGENGSVTMSSPLRSEKREDVDARKEHLMSGAIQLDGSPRDALDRPMSKNQLKKLLRQQKWDADKDSRKAARKQKNKARRARKRQEERQIRKDASAKGSATESSRVRSTQLPVTFMVDCSWEHLMVEKELISLAAQLTRCYSDNHRAKFRAHLAISSFDGRLRERFENNLHRTHENWKGVHFCQDDFVKVSEESMAWMTPENRGGFLLGQFDGLQLEKALLEREVVYLSSDADETLTELKPYSVYIIGGLVDKNRHKGVCYRKATEMGIKTARLPIGEYMDMVSRKILTVNHVNEIMVKWLDLGDWSAVFEAVIPKRKGAVLKAMAADEPNINAVDEEGDEDDGSEEDECDANIENQQSESTDSG